MPRLPSCSHFQPSACPRTTPPSLLQPSTTIHHPPTKHLHPHHTHLAQQALGLHQRVVELHILAHLGRKLVAQQPHLQGRVGREVGRQVDR